MIKRYKRAWRRHRGNAVVESVKKYSTEEARKAEAGSRAINMTR